MNVVRVRHCLLSLGTVRISLGLTMLAVSLLPALACRYNVRDVGFVDLGSEDYRLICYVSDRMEKADRDQIRNACLAALLDTNITPEIQTVSEDSDQWLTLSKELDLEGTPEATLPTAVLISPDLRRFRVPLRGGEALQDSLWDGLEALFDSPQRNEVMQKALSTYGVVVLLPGSDEALNNQARSAAKVAIEAVSERVLKNQLEKKIDQPPSLYELTGTLNREKALIWAMEMKEGLKEPQMAILYGRGRLIGSVLSGDRITNESVLAILGTIGLSCECGLDRSWMQGKMIPLRWDERTYAQTAKSLGFDPENPEVKIEISYILQKGESRRGARPTEATSPNLDLLIPSYGETWIKPQEGTLAIAIASSENGKQANKDNEGETPQVTTVSTEMTSPSSDEKAGSLISKTASDPGVDDSVQEIDASVEDSLSVVATIVMTGVAVGVMSLVGGLIFLLKSRRHR